MAFGLSLLAVSSACLSWWFFKQIRDDYGYVTMFRYICDEQGQVMRPLTLCDGSVVWVPVVETYYELGNYFGPAAFFKSVIRGGCGLVLAAVALWSFQLFIVKTWRIWLQILFMPARFCMHTIGFLASKMRNRRDRQMVKSLATSPYSAWFDADELIAYPQATPSPGGVRRRILVEIIRTGHVDRTNVDVTPRTSVMRPDPVLMQ